MKWNKTNGRHSLINFGFYEGLKLTLGKSALALRSSLPLISTLPFLRGKDSLQGNLYVLYFQGVAMRIETTSHIHYPPK